MLRLYAHADTVKGLRLGAHSSGCRASGFKASKEKWTCADDIGMKRSGQFGRMYVWTTEGHYR